MQKIEAYDRAQDAALLRLWDAIACGDVKEAAFWMGVCYELERRPSTNGKKASH